MNNHQPDVESSFISEKHVRDHSPHGIRKRLAAGHRPNYLPDFIYGAIDGAVTTFAVVSGVAGADLSPTIVIVLGFANLIGDGFSMAASNYLGTRVEHQLQEKSRVREAKEIADYPAGEREEVRQIFAAKGFQGNDLERAVQIITSNKDRWIDTMLTDELGLSPTKRSSVKAAAATMSAFLLIGLIPLIPFVFAQLVWLPATKTYIASCLLTVIAFFFVGAAKSRFVEQSWCASGLETLTLGGAAAALAYFVGWSLRGLT